MSDDEAFKPTRGRPFPKGESGNPAGRPKGARNRTTLLAEALLEDDAEPLMRKIIDDAMAGDRAARRFLASRLIPAHASSLSNSTSQNCATPPTQRPHTTQ